MKNTLDVSIVMPALNEEKNIVAALEAVAEALPIYGLKAEIIAVNDGSSDATGALIARVAGKYPGLIRVITHVSPRGIGTSFWEGVGQARGAVMCMLPGDNENDPKEILRYVKLCSDVDLVVPFTLNKEVRSRMRNFVSSLYTCIVNAAFHTSFHYTNGTTLYRTVLLKEMSVRPAGFFYQTDLLIRLVKQGYLFAEVPYRLMKREAGVSKALSLKSLRQVAEGFVRLLWDVYVKRAHKHKTLHPESVSAKRVAG